MPRYSANLSMLFTELPFLQRFAVARRAGFAAVEYWHPEGNSLADVKSVLNGEGLTLVGINTTFGDIPAGEFGLAAAPGREDAFRASFADAMEFSAALGRPAVHVVAGNTDKHGADACWTTYLANLERCVEEAKGSGTTLLIEPLNRRDRQHYLVGTSDVAAGIIQEFAVPHLKLMFDIYHVQIAEGDIFARLRKYLPIIGHIQIAGVPDRGEPDRGELDYRQILTEIDRLGWGGWVGCEYKPTNPTEKGLGWIERFQPPL